ncbi:WG repeat-containing protein [Marinobacter salinexigens]|nr:WG repeat-containing protein [Marinobacter salinexigens]
MIAKKVAFLVVGCWLFSTSLSAAVIPPTAGPHTVSFSADQLTVKDSGTGYSAVVQVESRLTVGVLIGEPVFTCVASWKLLSVYAGDDGFDAGLTGSSQGSFSVTKLPASVLNDIVLYDVDIAYPLAPGLAIKNNRLMLCDAGIMKTAGSNKPSFNFPSSPSWSELFWNDISDRYEEPQRAKELYVDMLSAYEERSSEKSGFFSWMSSPADKWPASVQSASINLWAVKSWLRKSVRESAERAQREAEAFEKKKTTLVDRNGKAGDDAFDSFMTAVYQKDKAKRTFAELDQKKATKPDNAAADREKMIASLPNSTCADSESLARINGDWEAGGKMQKALGACAGQSFTAEFVATEECGGEYEHHGLGFGGPTISYFCGWSKHYFADRNGRQLTPAVYSLTTGFSDDGFAAVLKGDIDFDHSGWIRSTGDWQVINRHFDVVKSLDSTRYYVVHQSFRGNRLIFLDRDTNKYGALDGRFNVVIPAKYDSLDRFDAKLGTAKACNKTSRGKSECAQIDMRGKPTTAFR